MTMYLNDASVRRLLEADRLLAAMRQALIDLSLRRVLQPLRTAMEVPGGTLFLKPALAGNSLATKIISFFPGNAVSEVPSLSSTIVLMDPTSGRTLAVMDGDWITAQRTAAVSAVAIDALSTPGEKVVAMLGSGVLARTHADMIRRVRPVRELRIWSRSPHNVAACASDVGGIGVSSAEAAVRGADLVCTLTNAQAPVLRGEWLKRGAVVAAVGAPRPTWRELDDAAMSNPVVADSRESAESESGDVILSGASIYAEIGEILAGLRAAPAGAALIFKSLGQAVEDAIAARLVYDAALQDPALRESMRVG